MAIEIYELEIIESKHVNSESIIIEIADRYEDDLLENDDFPEGYFEFFLRLLSEKKFYSIPGICEFVLRLGSEKEKLEKEGRYQEITETILSNFLYYSDEELCLAICDFIARNYPYQAVSYTHLTLPTIYSV